METPHTLSNISNLMKFKKNILYLFSIFEKDANCNVIENNQEYILSNFDQTLYKTEFQSFITYVFIILM